MSSLAVMILPGPAYSASTPLLRYTAALLNQHGSDVLHVTHTHAVDHIRKACAARHRDRLVLIGKSLGTTAMAELSTHDLPPTRIDAVWLTPAFGTPAVRDAAAACTWRSLYVVGLADPTHDTEALRHVQRATGGHTIAIDGADHALEIPGDVHASLAALTSVITAIDDFVTTSPERTA